MSVSLVFLLLKIYENRSPLEVLICRATEIVNSKSFDFYFLSLQSKHIVESTTDSLGTQRRGRWLNLRASSLY